MCVFYVFYERFLSAVNPDVLVIKFSMNIFSFLYFRISMFCFNINIYVMLNDYGTLFYPYCDILFSQVI